MRTLLVIVAHSKPMTSLAGGWVALRRTTPGEVSGDAVIGPHDEGTRATCS